MANISGNITAAVAVVGYDLLTSEVENRQPYARTIVGVGCIGSAAIGDFEFELRVNGKSEGRFQNTTVGVGASNPGAVAMDKDLKKVDIYVPANSRIEALVTDAATTNAVKCELHFGRLASSGRRFTRRTGTTRTSGARRYGGTRRPQSGMY